MYVHMCGWAPVAFVCMHECMYVCVSYYKKNTATTIAQGTKSVALMSITYHYFHCGYKQLESLQHLPTNGLGT